MQQLLSAREGPRAAPGAGSLHSISAKPTANSCKRHHVSVAPGAQFGDEEEEEDEAGPMEGVTEALADVGGQLPLSDCFQMGPWHI